MPNPWADIFARLGAVTNAGASEAEMGRFERDAGVTLSGEFRRLMSIANGAWMEEPYVRLLSLDEMRPYIGPFLSQEPGVSLGYVALTDCGQSNPLCVCTRGPLDGYVVRVNHDDDMEIAYRSLGDLFTAVERLAAAGEGLDEEDLTFDFGPDRSTRTEGDVRRGLELLKAADKLEPASDERLWLLILGMQLMSEAQVDVVASYLEDEWFVRRVAKATLSEMTVADARRALDASQRQMEAFARRVADAFRAAGLKAEVPADVGRPDRDAGIWVEPGNIGINLEVAFNDRHNPAAVQRLIERAKQRRIEQGSPTS